MRITFSILIKPYSLSVSFLDSISRYSPIFPSKSFIILHFTCRCMINFKINFVKGVRLVTTHLCVSVQYFKHYLFKGLSWKPCLATVPEEGPLGCSFPVTYASVCAFFRASDTLVGRPTMDITWIQCQDDLEIGYSSIFVVVAVYGFEIKVSHTSNGPKHFFFL
jgi:hypothetical protein